MQEPDAEEMTEFQGTFTPEIREKLSEKIRSVHVSQQTIARFLGLSVSTLHKWQSGLSPRCASSQCQLLRNFLRGEYDEALQNAAYQYAGEKFLPVMLTVYNCLPGAICHYESLGDASSKKAYLQQLSDIIDKAFQSLLEPMLRTPSSWPHMQQLLRANH